MAIGRISGPMLRANLERQGVDLSVETDLLYIDVNNNRIGINKAVPVSALDLAGTATFNDNLSISGTTISSINSGSSIFFELNGAGTVNFSNLTAGRVPYVGTGGAIVDSANLTFDGSSLSFSGTANLGNLSVTDNTIVSTNTNGNIALDPDGSGTVNISTLTAGRVVFAGSAGSLTDNANFTFNGSDLSVNGDISVTTASLGNIDFVNNTISSANIDGDIILSPNGTGNIVVDSSTINGIFYSGPSQELLSNSSLTYDGSSFTIDNISITSNTISSTNTNGNITVSPNGVGQLIVSGNTALTVPAGTTAQRPAGASGDLRLNNELSSLEFFDGVGWQTISTVSASFFINTFDGDGSTTQFTLSAESSSNNTIITLNGVVQSPGNSYSISGTTLTFTEAPRIGDAIEVRFLSNTFSLGSRIYDNTTSLTVSDSEANIIGVIGGSEVFEVTSSAATFNGTILGTGSVASISAIVPASSTASGSKGTIAYDSNYVYICVATDTWIRSSIQTVF